MTKNSPELNSCHHNNNRIAENIFLAWQKGKEAVIINWKNTFSRYWNGRVICIRASPLATVSEQPYGAELPADLNHNTWGYLAFSGANTPCWFPPSFSSTSTLKSSSPGLFSIYSLPGLCWYLGIAPLSLALLDFMKFACLKDMLMFFRVFQCSGKLVFLLLALIETFFYWVSRSSMNALDKLVFFSICSIPIILCIYAFLPLQPSHAKQSQKLLFLDYL